MALPYPDPADDPDDPADRAAAAPGRLTQRALDAERAAERAMRNEHPIEARDWLHAAAEMLAAADDEEGLTWRRIAEWLAVTRGSQREEAE